jgi:hypothetical protein
MNYLKKEIRGKGDCPENETTGHSHRALLVHAGWIGIEPEVICSSRLRRHSPVVPEPPSK